MVKGLEESLLISKRTRMTDLVLIK